MVWFVVTKKNTLLHDLPLKYLLQKAEEQQVLKCIGLNMHTDWRLWLRGGALVLLSDGCYQMLSLCGLYVGLSLGNLKRSSCQWLETM